MQTKAENTKERKREEKERKGEDLDWLNFFVFLESTSAAQCEKSMVAIGAA